MAEGGGRWADGGWNIILESISTDKLAALTQYCSLQDNDLPLELDNLSEALRIKLYIRHISPRDLAISL